MGCIFSARPIFELMALLAAATLLLPWPVPTALAPYPAFLLTAAAWVVECPKSQKFDGLRLLIY